jgi:hypothetical protein
VHSHGGDLATPRFGRSRPAQDAGDHLQHEAASADRHPSASQPDTPADTSSVGVRPVQPNGSVGHGGSSPGDDGEPPTLVLPTPPGSRPARARRKTREREQDGREDRGKPASSGSQTSAPPRDLRSDQPKANTNHDPAHASAQEILTWVFGSPEAEAGDADEATEAVKPEAPTPDR